MGYVRKWSGNYFHCGKGSENPEFRNDFLNLFFPKPEISGTLFQNFGTVRNIVPESSGLGNNRTGIFSLEKVLENVKDILNLIIECAPGLAEVKVILLWTIMKYKSWLPCLKIISSTENCGKEDEIYSNT